MSEIRLRGAVYPVVPSGRATRAHWLRPGASLSGPSNPGKAHELEANTLESRRHFALIAARAFFVFRGLL